MAYQNILVPVDGSETSYAAVAQAAELAKAFGGKNYSRSSACT